MHNGYQSEVGNMEAKMFLEPINFTELKEEEMNKFLNNGYSGVGNMEAKMFVKPINVTKLKEEEMKKFLNNGYQSGVENMEDKMVDEPVNVAKLKEQEIKKFLKNGYQSGVGNMEAKMFVEPLNVTELNEEEIKKFLNSFDHVFSDCDGAIWLKSPLPRSGEFFDLMEKHGKTVHFVSNNSLRNKEEYEKKFIHAGIKDGYGRLAVPSKAIVEYFKSVNLTKKIYCVACIETMRQLEASGFTCETGPNVGTELYYDYVQYLVDDPEIGAVVFDSDHHVNLPKLYRAATYLKRPEVHFANGATDKILSMSPGVTVLGTGVFADLVIEQVKRVPVQLGKPGKEFAQFVMQMAGVTDPSRVLFIGDMIAQDVGLGKVAGFKTLLVLTSHTREDMLEQTTLRPDYYAPSLGSMVPLL